MIHLFQRLVKEVIVKKGMKIIGVIISVIAAAAIWLILHFSSKEKTSSVLFIITTAIDIVLILDSVMLYRLFSHLL